MKSANEEHLEFLNTFIHPSRDAGAYRIGLHQKRAVFLFVRRQLLSHMLN
jgi:hypothetical protein